MCIRDSPRGSADKPPDRPRGRGGCRAPDRSRRQSSGRGCCLLYTSDAADERSSVDLGGRRIIKKKKNYKGSDVLDGIGKREHITDEKRW